MTDDERREAERYFEDYNAEHVYDGQGSRSIMDFTAGYAAACEAKRATADVQREMFGPAGVKHIGELIMERNAERARSKKLAGFLKSLMLLQPPQAMQTEFWVEVSHELEVSRD